jgi:hypothetical protein
MQITCLYFIIIAFKISKLESLNDYFYDYNEYPYDDLMKKEQIVNEHSFAYTINPGHGLCEEKPDSSIFLLIYVHTTPGNLKRRDTIRNTYARRSMFRDIRLVFMTGFNI